MIAWPLSPLTPTQLERCRRKAANITRKAAENGHPWAQHKMGYLMLHKHGAAPDYAEAMKWFLKAAEQGHTESQLEVGRMYYQGKGTPQHFSQAYSWFSLAAEQSGTPAPLSESARLAQARRQAEAPVPISESARLAQIAEAAARLRELAAAELSPVALLIAHERALKLRDRIQSRRVG